MRIKKLTSDCRTCNYFKIDNDANFICNWGHGKSKMIIVDNKRKSLISCKLNR